MDRGFLWLSCCITYHSHNFKARFDSIWYKAFFLKRKKIPATRSQNYYCNLMNTMTVSKAKFTLQGRGGEFMIFKTDIFKHCLWTQTKNWQCFCMKLWRVFCSEKTNFLYRSTETRHLLLRVNFYTITWSAEIQHSPSNQILQRVYISKGIVFPFHSLSICLVVLMLFFHGLG